jgi:hypothetical protein
MKETADMTIEALMTFRPLVVTSSKKSQAKSALECSDQ